MYVSRGGEYEIARRDIEVTPGGGETLELSIARSAPTPGWMTADTHLHALLSPDSPDSDTFKVAALAAANVELPVSTDHEAVGDFNPAIRELGLEPWMRGISGTEVTTIRYGHFNAFPLTPDRTKPGNGRIDWYKSTPSEIFARIRATPGDPFLQVNHPRSGTIGYFDLMDLDRSTLAAASGSFSAGFDGIEVVNGCGDGSMARDTIQDWFSFLNHGVRVAATGSSDDHRAGRGRLGLPVTYVRMPADDPPEADPEALRRAFKEGRLIVSCGPFVDLRSGDAEIGDLVTPRGLTLALESKVTAPRWMDVDELAILVNGEVVERLPIPESQDSLRFSGRIEVPLPPGQDAWIIAWASGDRRHGIWAQNRPSFAFTNPLFVDGDGDGAWRGPLAR